MSLVTQRAPSTIIAIDSVIGNEVSLFLAAFYLFSSPSKQISNFDLSFHVKNTLARNRHTVA
jgi:hypothetical protein